MGSIEDTIREYAGLVVEARVREADISGDKKVPFGSAAHVRDLTARIRDASSWRDKQRRGSEARANYSRMIARLRSELKAAERQASNKRTRRVVEGTDRAEPAWWRDPALRDPDSPSYMPPEELFNRMGREPAYKPYIDAIIGAGDPRELAAAKKRVHADSDAGLTDIPDGMWLHFYERRRAELRNMAPAVRSASAARADRILRTRDSSGRAKARKW